jgi:glutamate racemase
VAEALTAAGIAGDARTPAHTFLATDAPDRFARVGEIFLGQPIDPGQVELVDLQS